MVERIHQSTGNVIRTFQVQCINDLDENDPWLGMLAATMFATCATHHATMKATPMQLAFGCDAILNAKFMADWDFVKNRKQHVIHQNNVCENSRRIPCQHQLGEKVLLKQAVATKHGDNIWDGPCAISQVCDNGTARVKRNQFCDAVNIRLIKPCRSMSD